jgi:molybdopterin-guanine dinucleotide biosynthesis protein A
MSGLDAVREDPPGAGPLAALLAGAGVIGNGDTLPVLLVACDLPFVEAPLLHMLAAWPASNDALVPVVRGRLQYVCARYGSAALDAARRSHAAGERSLRGAFGEAVTALPESVWREVAPAHALDDVDTPDDLAHPELAGHTDR